MGVVTEVDPICALQACMAGYEVVRIEDVLDKAEIFVTTTGNCGIIRIEHMEKMRHNAIVGNIGHFDNEIQVKALKEFPGIKRIEIKPQVDQFVFPDGHATGHPSFVMSNSFTNQTLAQISLWKEKYELGVYTLPVLSDKQAKYLGISKDGPYKPDHYRY